MKRKSILLTAISIVVVCVSLLLIGCERGDSIEEVRDSVVGNPPGSYYVIFDINDEETGSFAKFRISSDDEEYINNLSADNIHYKGLYNMPSFTGDSLAESSVEDGSLLIEPQPLLHVYIETIEETLGDNVIGSEYGLKNDRPVSYMKRNSTPKWKTQSYFAYAPYNTIFIKNRSCQTSHCSFYSKKKSWYWNWTNEGKKHLGPGQYWEFCRQNKHALEVSHNSDESCGQYAFVQRFVQSACSN